MSRPRSVFLLLSAMLWNVFSVSAGLAQLANTKIAFVSFRDGNSEVYVMNPDGTNPVNLTNNPEFDFDPVWSPDGTKIAFQRFDPSGDQHSDIYVMNVDGTNVVNLTNNPADDRDPVWSPDGMKIAFTSSGRAGVEEIYVMNAADGSGPTNLTNNPEFDHGPAWSPFPQGPTAVAMTHITAMDDQGVVRLQWQTSRESQHAGFHLYRSLSEHGRWERVNATLITSRNHMYQFTDRDVQTNHTYFYHLDAVDIQGIVQSFGPLKVTIRPPQAYVLSQNAPNPFNPSTQIAYDVPQQAYITLMVYNLLGQEVVRLVDTVQQAGRYRVLWDGRNAQGQAVSSGVYLYRMTTSTGFTQTRRMTLVK